tara:strand:- start:348 stop:545 length:198 start_codon:yes stop_codon:yes gene_type:complete
MPAATTTTTTRAPLKKTGIDRNQQSRFASTQSRFASSKLIQNLGSSNDGAQFKFVSDLRIAFGRD